MDFLLCLVLLIGLIIIYYGKLIYDHRKLQEESGLIDIRKGILSSILRGELFKAYGGEHLQIEYNNLTSQNKKHGVFFTFRKQEYFVVDSKYMKNILQQDFQYFTERGFSHIERDDFLSANLSAIGGEKWKNIQTKLSPAFTSSKINGIFDTCLQCGYKLESAVIRLYKNNKVFDYKDVSNCYSINVISSCDFSLNNNCFKHPNSEFQKQSERIFKMSPFRIAKIMVASAELSLGRFLKIRLFDNEITNFFTHIVKEVINLRKTNNVTIRKDTMQQLIKLTNSEDDIPVTVEEITTHASAFFAAGFETSSETLTFCLYELSLNLEIQNKLREEVKQVMQKYDEELSYESLTEMIYLNQVINETLRKYPPVPYITRVCEEDYKVFNTDVTVTQATEVLVPIYALHGDPEFYPNPDKFDPERFSEKRKHNIRQFTFLPFGEGHQMCIGMRFGIIQLKIALALLLKKYEFSVNQETEIPLKIKPLSFTLIPQNKVILDIRKV